MSVSQQDLEYELRPIRDAILVNETEDTWDKIARAVASLRTMVQDNGALMSDYFAQVLRSLASPINSAIGSERSRLSGAAMDLISTAAAELGKAFDPLLPIFMPNLLTLCGRPNKVFVTRARSCVITIIESTQSPQILQFLQRSSKDKSASLRLAVAEATLACLQSFNPPDLQKETRGQEVETLIKAFATDANADIRKVGRKIFEAYCILLPTRVDRFVAPLTPTVRKYLAVSAKTAAKTAAPTNSNPPSRPPSSQSTRSTLTSSHSTSSVPTAAGSRDINNTRSNPTRPGLVKRAETDYSEPGPSRPFSRASERAVTAPKRPESRAENVQHQGEMLPPAHIPPSRPRREEPLSLHDLEPSGSNQPRSRNGPMRPAPGQTVGNAHDEPAAAEQKRPAGGARRVLRPEPPPKESKPPERSTTIEDLRSSASTSERASRPAATVTQRPASALDKRAKPPPARSAASRTGNVLKPVSTASEPAAAESRPSRTRPPAQKQPSVRPPSQSQAQTSKAAQSSKVTTSRLKPVAAPAPAKQKVAPKPSKPAKPAKDVQPALIPLPRTPSRPSTPVEAPPAEPELHSDSQDEAASDTPVVPRLTLDVATPQGQSTELRRALVEQTPISALVESIQRGFMFTPAASSLYSVDEGSFCEESEEADEPFPPLPVAPPAWQCKPLTLTKHSS